jgi:hypothetical protein
MFTSLDKALVALVMALVFIAQSVFHVSIPGWLTADNVNQVIAVLTPILIYVIPNKPAAAAPAPAPAPPAAK